MPPGSTSLRSGVLVDEGGSGGPQSSHGSSFLCPAKISGTLQFSTESRQKEISNNYKQFGGDCTQTRFLRRKMTEKPFLLPLKPRCFPQTPGFQFSVVLPSILLSSSAMDKATSLHPWRLRQQLLCGSVFYPKKQSVSC